MPKSRSRATLLELTLRRAGDADRDAIARVWLDGWRSTGIVLAEAPDYAGLRTRVDSDIASGWQVTVAEQEGKVVGFVALRPDQAKLDQIFVAPEAHRQGVGRALFGVARTALPAGFSLWTHGENADAKRFYAALGPLRQEDGVHPRHGHPIVTYWFAGT